MIRGGTVRSRFFGESGFDVVGYGELDNNTVRYSTVIVGVDQWIDRYPISPSGFDLEFCRSRVITV